MMDFWKQVEHRGPLILCTLIGVALAQALRMGILSDTPSFLVLLVILLGNIAVLQGSHILDRRKSPFSGILLESLLESEPLRVLENRFLRVLESLQSAAMAALAAARGPFSLLLQQYWSSCGQLEPREEDHGAGHVICDAG